MCVNSDAKALTQALPILSDQMLTETDPVIKAMYALLRVTFHHSFVESERDYKVMRHKMICMSAIGNQTYKLDGSAIKSCGRPISATSLPSAPYLSI